MTWFWQQRPNLESGLRRILMLHSHTGNKAPVPFFFGLIIDLAGCHIFRLVTLQTERKVAELSDSNVQCNLFRQYVSSFDTISAAASFSLPPTLSLANPKYVII